MKYILLLLLTSCSSQVGVRLPGLISAENVEAKETKKSVNRDFCNRSDEVKQAIIDLVRKPAESILIDSCEQVTNYMLLTAANGGYQLDLTRVTRFKKGDLDDFPAKLEILLPDLKSFPDRLFRDVKYTRIDGASNYNLPLLTEQLAEFNDEIGDGDNAGFRYSLVQRSRQLLKYTGNNCAEFYKQNTTDRKLLRCSVCKYESFRDDAVALAKEHSLYEHFKDEFVNQKHYKSVIKQYNEFQSCKGWRKIDWSK